MHIDTQTPPTGPIALPRRVPGATLFDELASTLGDPFTVDTRVPLIGPVAL